jgi:hypothetical protein
MDVTFQSQDDGSQILDRQWNILGRDMRDEDGEWQRSTEYTQLRAVVEPGRSNDGLYSAKIQYRDLDQDDPSLEQTAEWEDWQTDTLTATTEAEARRLAYVTAKKISEEENSHNSGSHEVGLEHAEGQWDKLLAENQKKFGVLIDLGNTLSSASIGMYVNADGYYVQAALDENGLPKELSVEMDHLFSFDDNKLEKDQSEWASVAKEKEARDPEQIKENFAKADGNLVRYAIDNGREVQDAIRDGLAAGVVDLNDGFVQSHFYDDAAQNDVGPFTGSAFTRGNAERKADDWSNVLMDMKASLSRLEDKEGLNLRQEKLQLTALAQADPKKPSIMEKSAELVYGINKDLENYNIDRTIPQSEAALITDRASRAVVARAAVQHLSTAQER